MTATILLCLLSSLTFCLCVRFLITFSGRGTLTAYARVEHGRAFSLRARRFARGYLVFAMAILAAASFFGAVTSYIELFG